MLNHTLYPLQQQGFIEESGSWTSQLAVQTFYQLETFGASRAARISYQTRKGQHTSPKTPAAALLGFQMFSEAC